MTESKQGTGDDACCYCCIGLAIGYLIFSNSGARGATTHDTKPIEQIVQQDNYLLKQIDNYQKNISPKIKEELGKEKLCRFEPSCSEYAKQAIEKYGSIKGSLMATKRLAKCNPLSKGGYDPVK